MSITFVVGTGRCGSTMLSRALQAHPDVLSMNEFFTSVACRGTLGFGDRQVDGREFWAVLGGPVRPLDAIAASAYPMPELLYPYGSGRFRPETGVPTVSHMTLPALTDTPDALYDALADAVSGWPSRTLPDQYRALFADLRRRENTSVVVERSGASLAFLPALRAMFPEARFVHLSRSGPDVALSMSRHIGFRALLLRTEAMALLGLASPFELGPEHVRLLPDHLAHLADDVDCDLVMRSPIPLAAFGAFWSRLVVRGVEELAHVPADRRMSLSYEEILDDPEGQFARLAAFAGADPHPGWLRGAAASVLRTDRPPVTDPDTLTACEPGTRALAHQATLFADTADTADTAGAVDTADAVPAATR
ncbi:sulfotransferase [Streptomyces sp. NPDC094032]|uniref:sulfotransferase n=1 Tax=Streptomyces sp. NPDC094032 TaxID=3155308 RepID=UPI00331C77B6